MIVMRSLECTIDILVHHQSILIIVLLLECLEHLPLQMSHIRIMIPIRNIIPVDLEILIIPQRQTSMFHHGSLLKFFCFVLFCLLMLSFLLRVLFLVITILIRIIIRMHTQCLLIRLPFVMMFQWHINKVNQDIRPLDNNQVMVMQNLIHRHMLNIMVLNNEPKTTTNLSGHCQHNEIRFFSRLIICLVLCLFWSVCSISSLNYLFFFGVWWKSKWIQNTSTNESMSFNVKRKALHFSRFYFLLFRRWYSFIFLFIYSR